jgi:hypothetical protein
LFTDTNSARDCAHDSTALAERAEKSTREQNYAERRTAIPETSKKLRTHPKRQNYSLGFDSERLTRLCGTGVPFRPLFSSIPSCIVPEEKILPTARAKNPRRAYYQGKTTPDKTQSIGEKNQCVKSDSQQAEENFAKKFSLDSRMPSPNTILKSKNEAKLAPVERTIGQTRLNPSSFFI